MLIYKKISTRIIRLTIVLLFVLAESTAMFVLHTPAASALTGSDFAPGHIIDNSIFTNSTALSVAQIQTFLNDQVTCDTNGTQTLSYYYNSTTGQVNNSSTGTWVTTTRAIYGQRYATWWNSQPAANQPADYVTNESLAPYVCLQNYVENPSTGQNNLQDPPSTTISGGLSAAQIIYNAAQTYSINPEVILTTLQKEQGLVTDEWPWLNEYTEAMGYNCPDTGNGCSGFAGFTQQVNAAAAQYENYMKNPNNFNYIVGSNTIDYNVPSSCPYTESVTIQNQATAALYDYTPYTPDSNVLNSTNPTGSSSGPGSSVTDICASYGNRNFWWYFNTWFGASTGCGGDPSLGITTNVIMGDTPNGFNPYYVIDSGTGEGCVEVHGWNNSFSNWVSHIATNQQSINSTNSEVAVADLYGNDQLEFILVGLADTPSGYIEFHVWNPTLQTWTANIVSNQPCIDPANSTVEFADLDGNGSDQAVLVGLRDTGSGMVEFHIWNPGFTSWQANIASNQPAVDPANSAIGFGDVDGNGRDQAILEGLQHTGSGMVEFHIWNPGESSWQANIASNQPADVNPVNSTIDYGDFNGNGRDEAILVGLNDTGSGMVEFHVWNPGESSWQANIASNQEELP